MSNYRAHDSTLDLVITSDLVNFLSTYISITLTQLLGYDDVPWNNDKVLAPNLRYLSSHGIVLDNHYSQSVCSPARAALLTGYYPIRLGLQVKEEEGLGTTGMDATC